MLIIVLYSERWKAAGAARSRVSGCEHCDEKAGRMGSGTRSSIVNSLSKPKVIKTARQSTFIYRRAS